MGSLINKIALSGSVVFSRESHWHSINTQLLPVNRNDLHPGPHPGMDRDWADVSREVCLCELSVAHSGSFRVTSRGAREKEKQKQKYKQTW